MQMSGNPLEICLDLLLPLMDKLLHQAFIVIIIIIIIIIIFYLHFK